MFNYVHLHTHHLLEREKAEDGRDKERKLEKMLTLFISLSILIRFYLVEKLEGDPFIKRSSTTKISKVRKNICRKIYTRT